MHLADRFLARPEGQRRYLVGTPPGAAGPRPAVLLLHGHGASPEFMLGTAPLFGCLSAGWRDLGTREQLLLLAPEGTVASDGKKAWNDCRGDAATNATSDDVGFLDAVLDTAIAEHGADPDRIFVYGSSNGGGMAYRLACERGARLAGIGLQSALMAAASCCPPPRHPLSVYLTHGTADRVTPYAGGAVGTGMDHGRGSVLSVDASLAIWRELAGLPDAPAIHDFPHLDPKDRTAARRYVWGDDRAAPQVALLRVEGGGHTAPTRSPFKFSWMIRQFIGETNRDLEFCDELWDFFKDKRRA